MSNEKQDSVSAPAANEAKGSSVEPLLSVRHLKKYFKMGKGSTLKAVDDVSFDIMPG